LPDETTYIIKIYIEFATDVIHFTSQRFKHSSTWVH